MALGMALLLAEGVLWAAEFAIEFMFGMLFPEGERDKR